MKVVAYDVLSGQHDHQALGDALSHLEAGKSVGRVAVLDKVPAGQLAGNTVQEALATIKASTIHVKLMQSVADKVYANFPEGSKQRTRADKMMTAHHVPTDSMTSSTSKRPSAGPGLLRKMRAV